jgi:beta-xylosidase
VITASPTRRHANPIYDSYFADPFVWKYGRAYYAIGTGDLEANGTPDTRVFPLLTSRDFYHWQFVGRPLLRPDVSLGMNFWAPAVAVQQDRFYLYYSVGHGDKNHQLRVAVGHEPAGPYQDIEAPLLDTAVCPFAIDPHPFQDIDGRWYLFYARDFLDTDNGFRAGTALMFAPMKSMTELDGQGFPVLRARRDWQRFKSNREMYGGVYDWHTLEGPSVWLHDGKYYCFYSGGCWEDETYGVDYGIADQIMGPWSDDGNETGPRVMKTLPGRLIGPGHNCIVAGPDGRTDFIVHHAWNRNMTRRQVHINELVWGPAGPRCLEFERLSQQR